MKTRFLFLLVMLGLAAALSAQATGLFISEYVEGTSYNKAIEVFNGTGAPVDLSTYALKKQTNGAGAFGASGASLALTGTLANNDVFVVVSSATGGTNLATQPFVDLATTNQAINFNGNDAVALYHNDVQVDVVGIANDPTTPGWGANVTLIRNSTVISPTINFTMDEWTSNPVDTFTNLGTHVFTGGTTDPLIIVSSPNTAVTWYAGLTYDITWTSAHIDGNVQIELNNNEAYSTLADDIENTGSFSWTIPVNQPVGTQFKIRVSNMTATVSDMSDVFFTITLPTAVPTIAQLRASAPDGTTVYSLTNEVILTFQQTYRFQKYIQDATAAVLIDDNSGKITSTYAVGDGITGITGKLSEYAGMLQFVPEGNPGAATSTGNVVTPQIITLNDLTTNFEAYESELVKINNCTFTGATGAFVNGTVYPINDSSGNYNFRTTFYSVDYIGQNIPTTPMNVVGIPNSRLDATVVNCYLTSRDAADIQTPTAQAAAPSFDPPAGLFHAPITVAITSTTATAVIHYTLDGTDPTAASEVYSTPIPLSVTTTVKAIAIADGMPASDISVATYTIVVSNDDMINGINQEALLGNYPNPFSPNTTISFNVKSQQTVQIVIYNTKGQLIRTLKSDVKTAGVNNVVWNAKDENGKRVSAGLYLYHIKGGKFSSSKKMILLK